MSCPIGAKGRGDAFQQLGDRLLLLLSFVFLFLLHLAPWLRAVERRRVKSHSLIHVHVLKTGRGKGRHVPGPWELPPVNSVTMRN